MTRWRQAGKRGRVLGQLNSDDPASLFSLALDPAQLRAVKPVNVWTPRQCVAPIEGLSVVRGVGHGHACPDGVAGAEQGAEVGLVCDPQWRHDQMVPASVLTNAPVATDFRRLGLRSRRHRSSVEILSFTRGALGGGAMPSTGPPNVDECS